jgi:hypothetical protein
LIDYRVMFVNEFGFEERELADEICERVSESALTACRPGNDAEQPAQIIGNLQPHLKA